MTDGQLEDVVALIKYLVSVGEVEVVLEALEGLGHDVGYPRGDRISAYWLDTGTKLIISDEMAQTLHQEQERTAQLEAELACYQERFGDLTTE